MWHADTPSADPGADSLCRNRTGPSQIGRYTHGTVRTPASSLSRLFIVLILSCACTQECWSGFPAGEELAARLSLNDTKGAFALLQNDPGLYKDPRTVPLVFELLAAAHDFDGMRRLWKERGESGTLPRETVEAMAWEAVRYATQSPHPKVRLEALIAATMSQDARGVRVVERLLLDHHQGIQLFALQCALYFPDECIQKQAEVLAQTGHPEVQIAAARLLANQKAPHVDSLIRRMLLSEHFSESDQVELLACMGQIGDQVSLEWVREQVADGRPSVRAIAAAAVVASPTPEKLLALLPLLNDSSSVVRKEALQAVGLWQSLIPEHRATIIQACRNNSDNPSFELAAISAWALALSTDSQARHDSLDWLRRAICEKPQERALMACGCLGRTGAAGLELAAALVAEEDLHPLCSLNLATYLLAHGHALPAAKKALAAALSRIRSLVSEQERGIFSWIGLSDLPHHPLFPRLPESEDLLIRLRLTALQAYTGSPLNAGDVETMLRDRGWGISAAAAILLFQEAMGSLDDLLEPLLSSDVETVRVQAALLLTMLAQSPKAAQVLSRQLACASKEGKEHLLLGFGSLPFSETGPYLTPLLFESSDSLRTRAAGALLSSMYQ